MNKKGFTLIELLAVIVILAIIALITSPIILGVIEGARKDAAKDKAWGTINAVDLAYAQDQIQERKYKLGTPVTFNNKKASVGTTSVKASGELPESGTVIIREDGSIIAQNLKFKDYTCSTVKSETDNTIDPNNVECVKGNWQIPTNGVVYRSTGDYLNIGDSIEGIQVTTNPTAFERNYYLKHEIKDKKITASYVCFVTDWEHCLQGGVEHYETNKALLQNQKTWFTSNDGNCRTSTYDSHFECSYDEYGHIGELEYISIFPNGLISAGRGDCNKCSIGSSGFSSCVEMNAC